LKLNQKIINIVFAFLAFLYFDYLFAKEDIDELFFTI